MNNLFSEIYNEEDDIYYVTFKSGEPSYCLEMDGRLLIEMGLFTNLPTGFRILDFKKHKISAIQIRVLFKKIKDTLSELNRPTLGDREARVKTALEEVLV